MTDIGYAVAASAVRTLPSWMSDILAVGVADLYTWTHAGRARAIDRHLRRIWVETGSRGAPPTARQTHRAFARALRDFLATGSKGARPLVRLPDADRLILDEARASGRSTVVVSGHFGPWEVALQWLAREVGPVGALARAHRQPAVERFFASRRALCGVHTLSTGRPASAALALLAAGGWIAALADRGGRRRPGAHERGVEPRNAGIVRLDPAPLLIARRAGAQVLAGVAWRARDGATEVRFHPAFSLEPRPGGIGIPPAVARLQHFFDAHVREHPTQWFDWSACLARREDGRPAGRSG